MATLLLTGLGSAVGGDLGAIAGSLLGRSIDNGLFGGRGARIKADLTVQTSAYGRTIPRIYGRMRVAGSVIWATDLQAGTASTGGKSGSATGYWANLAIALSSRPALRIHRIWADGTLIRGSDYVFKVPTQFRFLAGDEDQAVDPLIASIDAGAACAYRGLAIAVFEQLQLSAFGNRIPFFTFEVQADDLPPTAGAIVEDLAGESASGSDIAQEMVGYAADQPTLGDAIEPLTTALDLDWANATASSQMVYLSDDELGCTSREPVGRQSFRRAAAAETPNLVRLGYFDPALELQASEQKIAWGEAHPVERRIELPAALDASVAKTIAHEALTREWVGREQRTFRLPQNRLALRTGDRLASPDGTVWRIDRVRIEDLGVVTDCRRDVAAGGFVPASSGQHLPSRDVPLQPSELVLLDLPALDEAPSAASIQIAGRGGSEPFRPFPVVVSADSNELAQVMIARRAVLGEATTRLAEGSSELIDRANAVTVLLADDDWLESCSDEALLTGANLISLGDELLQFGKVEALGQRRFRLSRLLRGRYGTEWACGLHQAGEAFVLVRRDDFAAVELTSAISGSALVAEGHSFGDTNTPSVASCLFAANSLRPPAPVHLRALRAPDGSLVVDWVRRSRRGFHWVDYVDAPLAEETECYAVSVSGQLAHREWVVSEPAMTVDPSALAVFGAGELTVEVAQLGSLYPSRFATLQIRI